MIPPPTHPTWKKLIRGDTSHNFGVASASLLFFRLREQYKQQPVTLDRLVVEARRFFEKYESILVRDIERLFR